MVRALQLAAIRTFAVGRRRQRMMRAPHVAARGRGFLFRDGHGALVGAGCGEPWYLAKNRSYGNSDGTRKGRLSARFGTRRTALNPRRATARARQTAPRRAALPA